MPAVFQIVSRASAEALTRVSSANTPQGGTLPTQGSVSSEESAFVAQLTQNVQDPAQLWVLTPQDSAQDVLIQPFDSLDLAIGLCDDAGEAVEAESGKPGDVLVTPAAADGVVWRISEHPPYFFLLEGPNDLLMDLPRGTSDEQEIIQIFTRTEHNNQQWTFLPVFAELGDDG